MSYDSSDTRVRPLGLLNIKVERNAFGRQIHSFTANLDLKGSDRIIQGTFIRAPKISRLSTSIEVLAKLNGEPVAVRQGIHIGLVFHPELNNEPIFHTIAFLTSDNKTKHLKFPMNRA